MKATLDSADRVAGVPPIVLSIAGSDPCAAAGIQADLRVFTLLGCHGTAVATAWTVQDTAQVHACKPVPARWVLKQLDALLADLPVRAIKIGMLGSRANVLAVARALDSVPNVPVVLDPILVSSSGHALLHPAARAAMIERLLPRTLVLTPNRPEAESLLGQRIRGEAAARRAARLLRDLGPGHVLLKGGHARGSVVTDWHADEAGERPLARTRHAQGARGTGCALSSAIAARLSLGDTPAAAIRSAGDWLHGALALARPIGRSGVRVLVAPP